MYYQIGHGPLFRVASADSGNLWPDPVRGHGAFYVPKEGNRYSGPHQLTLYCAEDPLVAITEGAFYQAIRLQNDIASFRMKEITYPLVSEHLLWAFSIDPLPHVVDMESAISSNHFGYSPHLLLNPSRAYSGTRAVADDVRSFTPPAGSGLPNPEGMKVPSVRTPYVRAFQPHHLSLFVMDTPASIPYGQRSNLIAKMKIEFEFFTHKPSNSVIYQSPRIDWSAPKFRVTSIAGEPRLAPIPAYPGRPHARDYNLDEWHQIKIIF